MYTLRSTIHLIFILLQRVLTLPEESSILPERRNRQRRVAVFSNKLARFLQALHWYGESALQRWGFATSVNHLTARRVLSVAQCEPSSQGMGTKESLFFMSTHGRGGEELPGGSVGRKEDALVASEIDTTETLPKTKVIVNLVGNPVTETMVTGIERIAANLGRFRDTSDSVDDLHRMHDNRAVQLDRALKGV